MSAEIDRPHNDPELGRWITMGLHYGGGFIHAVCMAAMNADAENYILMRPLLVALKAKYPKYSTMTGEGAHR